MRNYSLKNDFTGDGYADLIVQDTTTGALFNYQLNSYVRIAQTRFLNSTGASLSVAQPYDIYTTGDFNADGKTDMVLKNSTTNSLYLWPMNGIIKSGGGGFVPATTTAAVQGAGDFDGDGRTDLVFQNPTTSAVSIWYLGPTGSTGLNTTRTAAANLSPQLTDFSGQRVAGVTDFNGDGHPDILIEDVRSTGATKGNIIVILLNAGLQSSATITQLAARQMVPINTDPLLRVVGVDDINAGGLADIVTHERHRDCLPATHDSRRANRRQYGLLQFRNQPGVCGNEWHDAGRSPINELVNPKLARTLRDCVQGRPAGSPCCFCIRWNFHAGSIIG